MSAKVLSFFRPAPGLRDDWSQQELAEFYRVEAATVQAGLRIVTDRGVSDEGDPWFVFCRVQDESVFLHVARINGLYWIAGDGIEGALRGPNFRALLTELTRTHPTFLPIPPQTGGAKVLLHPGALLAAIVATACLLAMPREALAHESGLPGEAAHTPDLPAAAAGGIAGHHGPAFEEALPADVPDTERRAYIAGLALLAASVALSMPDPGTTATQYPLGWLLTAENQGSNAGKAALASAETSVSHEGELVRRVTHSGGPILLGDVTETVGTAGLWPISGAPRGFTGSGAGDLLLGAAAIGPVSSMPVALDLRGLDLHDLGMPTAKLGDIAAVLLAARSMPVSTPASSKVAGSGTAAGTADVHAETASASAADKAQVADAAATTSTKSAAASAPAADSSSSRTTTTAIAPVDSSGADTSKTKAAGSGTGESVLSAGTKTADASTTKAASVGATDTALADIGKTDLVKTVIAGATSSDKVSDAVLTLAATKAAITATESHGALAQIGDGLTSTSQDALRKAGLTLPDTSASQSAASSSTGSGHGSSTAASSSATAASSTATHDAATAVSSTATTTASTATHDATAASSTATTVAKIGDAALGSTTSSDKIVAPTQASTPATASPTTTSSGTALILATSIDHSASASTTSVASATGNGTGSGTGATASDPSLRPLDAAQLQLINNFIANTPHLGATLVDHTLLLFDTVPVIGSSAQVTTWDLGDGSRLEIVGLNNVVHI